MPEPLVRRTPRSRQASSRRPLSSPRNSATLASPTTVRGHAAGGQPLDGDVRADGLAEDRQVEAGERDPHVRPGGQGGGADGHRGRRRC